MSTSLLPGYCPCCGNCSCQLLSGGLKDLSYFETSFTNTCARVIFSPAPAFAVAVTSHPRAGFLVCKQVTSTEVTFHLRENSAENQFRELRNQIVRLQIPLGFVPLIYPINHAQQREGGSARTHGSLGSPGALDLSH